MRFTLVPIQRRSLAPVAVALACASAMPALAQTTGSTASPTAKPTAAPTAPRQRIELPAAERKALEGASTAPASRAPSANELVPSAADAKTPAPEENQTRIEQVRTGNRISEIRVTPALTGRTYTITNREGRQPTSAVDTSSGLSVPKFFTFEWGRPDERPSPPLPPPPSSSTPR